MKYNFKKILFLNFFVLGFFACPVSFCGVFGVEEASAATYYVDATSGNDSNAGTSEDQAWQTISKINNSTFNPGDNVLFKRGEVWSEQLTIPSSGTLDNVITYDAFGEGDKPLLDLSSNSSNAYGVLINDVDYVTIRNLSVKGSGGAAAVRAHGASGSLGDGYNVEIHNVDVLSAYGASTGNRDCFSLDNTAQVTYRNITATGCRPNPRVASSDQSITGHADSKYKVYTATFSDSNNWVVNVGNAQGELYDITATGNYSAGFDIGSSGTENCFVKVYNSNITSNSGGAPVVNSSTTSNNAIVSVQDSIINVTNSTLHFARSTVKYINNSININDPSWRISTFGGDIYFIGNDINIEDVSSYFVMTDNTLAGSIYIKNNFFNAGDIFNDRIFRFGNTSYTGHINNNVFNNFNDTENIWILDNASAPTIYNNTFYNSARGGKLINLDHSGDEAENLRLTLKNNIFENINIVLDSAAGEAVTNYNNYYNSEDLGGIGSILTSSEFANPNDKDFQLTYTSPAIDSGTSVGLTTDYAGNPIYGTPDIGAYEYQPPHTIGSDKIDIGAGARIYGDGKFRDKEITSSNLADLSITPESGSFEIYESDEVRPEWMDIKNISWGDTKQWTESSPISSLTNTLHTIGDLEANKYYNVSVDDILGENIEGENCISGICKSNSEGKIAFTYTGTYSEYTFKVEVGDNTPPAVTSGTTLKFPTDTKEVTLSITTNENSTCKYSADESDEYDAMTAFETTGEKTHSTMYQIIDGPAIYNVYAICKDVVGNNTSHVLTFEIAKEKEDSKISGIKSDNLTLDESKRIYLEEDRTKLKGEDQTLASGKVKIYKNKKLYKEVEIDENGKWSKKISFDHNRKYTIKLEFFDEFGTLRDEKEYEIKVDTEKPVFQNEEESSSVTKDERISFPAKDEETKIDYYKIKVLDKNGHILRSWRKQNESFYLIPNKIKDEAKTVIVRAYDRAGNKSELRFEVGPRKALPRGEGPAQLSATGGAEEVQEVTEIETEVMDEKEELQESSPEPTTGNNSSEAKTEIQPIASEAPVTNSPASESKWWNPFSWLK